MLSKIKKYYAHLCAFLFCFITTATLLSTPQLPQETLASFLRPVSMTQAGIATFLTSTYNHAAYGTFCLPATFRHVDDFLTHTQNVKQQEVFVASVIDLFHARLKESLWVNPYALARLFDSLVANTQHLFTKSERRNHHDAVKKELYESLLTKFNDLKNDPEQFIETLTKKVLAITDHDKQQERIELQYAISRFIESALDKLVWDPREQQACWECCKMLATKLDSLEQLHIIPDEVTLNHCFWSLIYRFSYFIETAGDLLSMQTFQAIRQDIALGQTPLLALGEQEEHILTKAQRLNQAVLAGEVKVRSAQAGLWMH